MSLVLSDGSLSYSPCGCACSQQVCPLPLLGRRVVVLAPTSDSPLAPGPERRPQLEFLDLTIRQLRQRVDEMHIARTLVGGNPLPAVRDQSVRTDVMAGTSDHKGDHCLTPAFIRRADDRRL